MKELDGFTVERLEEILNFDLPRHPAALEEIVALARIALAAKRAEPCGYAHKNAIKFDLHDTCRLHEQAGDENFIALYTTPQLNSPEIPDGWIKCSDQMPENDEFVRILPLPDFGVELHVGQYIKYHANGPGWFAQVYEHNYGIEFYPITVTHWMPLLAAPEKENG
ncbi:DUF551 domain-containing protein [Yersinia enterocolitica]|nr:DUF551 domain-containing protein [Yersinia enterocolitica]